MSMLQKRTHHFCVQPAPQILAAAEIFFQPGIICAGIICAIAASDSISRRYFEEQPRETTRA
jgi:hypothetical protein